MDKYFPRLADKELKNLLSSFSAVLIRGPKWCGKTTTAKRLCKSEIKFSLKTKKGSFDDIASNNPSLFLRGAKPRLIDEWQIYPEVWDLIRDEADEKGLQAQYVLTGSSMPKLGTTLHTGTMRIARMEMGTMSLYESGESDGSVSLSSLFSDSSTAIASESKLSKTKITEAMVRGGWPQAIATPLDDLALLGQQYFKAICETDIQEAVGIALSPNTCRALIRSLARNISTEAANETIIEDVVRSGNDLSKPTFYTYFDALKRLFLVNEIPAWCPSIRSVTSMRSLPKKEFCDPSIACAALGIGTKALDEDFKARGFFFECLAGRDLKAYAQPIHGEISYYRDRLGLECDYVIHLPDGRYGLFECKCGQKDIQKGIDNLNKFDELIKKANEGDPKHFFRLPDVKAIITDEGFAFRRKEDGIFLIPLSCLKN
jgi:predicted AAA+ superfamily ATPase